MGNDYIVERAGNTLHAAPGGGNAGRFVFCNLHVTQIAFNLCAFPEVNIFVTSRRCYFTSECTLAVVK